MNEIFGEMWLRQQRHWAREVPQYVIKDSDQVHSALCLHLVSEVLEVLNCRDWKIHRPNNPSTREHLLEELIDVFKFWLCLMIHNEFTPEQMVDMFHRKSDIVETRAQREREKRNASTRHTEPRD